MMFAAMPGSCIASMCLHRVLTENTMKRTLKHGTFGEESSKGTTGKAKAWDSSSHKRQRLLNLKMKSLSVKGKGMIKAAVKGGVVSSWIPNTLKNLGWQAGKGALSKVSTVVSGSEREREKQVYRTAWKEGRKDLTTALLKEKWVECSNDGGEGQVWMRGKGSDKLETFFLLLSWRWQGTPSILVLKMDAWSTVRRYLEHSKAEITLGNTENRWCHLSERERVHEKRLQENLSFHQLSHSG